MKKPAQKPPSPLRPPRRISPKRHAAPGAKSALARLRGKPIRKQQP